MASDLALENSVPASAFGLRKSGLHVFLVCVACAYYLLNAPILLAHYDLGWHLAAGDLIRTQRAIPFHDPFSFTAGDRQWLNLSWGWDVLASIVVQYAGFGGLALLVTVAGGAIVFYLASLALGRGASSVPAAIAVLAASLLYPAFTAFPNIYLAASPNMVTMLFSVFFYGECLARSRRMILLPGLMLLWANLHGGFLMGLGIIGLFGGVALIRRDWPACKSFAAVGFAALAATFINPLGWHIYGAATATVGNFVQSEITEWLPYYRNIEWPGSLPGIAYILTFIALEIRYRAPCPLEARLMAWLFLVLGFYQFRYMAFFFLFSTIPFALGLDRLLPRQADGLAAEKSFWIGGLAVACALPLIVLRTDFDLPPMLPLQDVRWLQTHLPHARLLNHWNYGGMLIYRTHGTIPVFVDGRAATVYPDSVLRDYFKLTQWTVNEGDWDAVLAKYKIDTVLWIRSHQELRQFLVGKRGWKDTYEGAFVSIYTKP